MPAVPIFPKNGTSRVHTRMSKIRQTIICPADKGRAIVIEDRQTYLTTMQQQIDEGDNKLENRKEKTLLDKLHKKLINQLKNMDIKLDDYKEKRKCLVSAPVLGH